MKRHLIYLAALLAAAPAFAETDTTLANDSSRVVDLDEVIVVSQPKETFRLRQQPMSSTVFGQQEMERLNIRDLRQLSAYVPSFAMPQYGSRLTSSMYIRGLGSRVSNSAVGVYYDNIPIISPAAFNTHYYMLDRVDVLRGPQGTLYGANTEGGIVRVYSKNPMAYQGTDASLGLASGLQRRAEVAHFHRPSEQLAFSVAGFYQGQDGFFQNEALGEKNDKGDEAGAKLRLMWKPTGRLTFDLTADYQYTRQDAFPYGIYDVDDAWAALPSTNLMSGYKRNMLNTGLSIGYRTDGLLLSSNTSYQLLRDHMDMDIDYTAADRLALVQLQKMNAVTEELTLRSTGDGAWKHTTGIFGSRQWLRTDATVTFGQGLLGPIAGAIESQMRASMEAAKAGLIGRYMGQGMSPAEAAAAAQAMIDGVTMSAEMAVPNVFHQPQTNLAAYHESNLTLADRITATVGLRYDFTKAEIDYDSYGYMAMTGGTPNAVATYTLSSHIAKNHDTSFSQLLPKFGLSYRIDDHNSNVYATVSKGYMAGGYNIQLFSDILQSDLNDPVAQRQAQRGDVEIEHTEQDYADIEEAISYKPEESWNYEAGAHLNLFDGKLHADVAGFYTQLRNQQLSIMAPNFGFGRMTVNAGKSLSYGAELALRGMALDSKLSWAATYSYTHATFEEYAETETLADGTQRVLDYKDNRVPYVPEHAFSALADYRIDVANDAVLRSVVLGLNVTGRGKTYWDEANVASQKMYVLLGAHARFNMGCVDVDFWGRNLTDTKYCTFALMTDRNTGKYIGQRGLPLQLGVDVRMHF
ncbi:MAG: TonB-dependent receptor [Prevotella sp.]|nr:TonB-dependent receptor [Prevotella sp.]